jgi:acetolactate synthase-1/2/3 large subunit
LHADVLKLQDNAMASNTRDKKIKVADYAVDYLMRLGITQGYFMNGGMIAPIADACYRKGFELFTMHHEQAAAFASEGQAAVRRDVGVAMATSGPGATNLVTGIASAYFSSNPVLFITGQVNTYESNAGGERRQVGFQETDIVSITKGITKYAKLVNDPLSIAYELEKALFITKDGRMGPALLDLPFDVQRSNVYAGRLKHFVGSEEHRRLTHKINPGIKDAVLVAREISISKRPLVLIGHGVRLSDAVKEVAKLLEKANLPFVTSLLGTDAIPNGHRLCYGMIGTYGQRYANLATANADMILVLGARLDVRQIGLKSEFAKHAKIIHVDIDCTELNASVKEHMSIESDIGDFVGVVLQYVAKKDRVKWMEYLDMLRSRYGKSEQTVREGQIDPIKAVSMLSSRYADGSIVTVDVGSHQMWFAHGWTTKNGQSILTNGGMAPMGFALPAAIGASLALGKREVLAVTGDGGLQVNIQELQTVVRNKLPIKIVVFNNNALVMVTQFQSEFMEGRIHGSVPEGGYDSPDFVKIAKAYGIPAESSSDSSTLENKIDWLTRHKGPCLLEIKVPQDYWALPKSRGNLPVHDMFPFLDRREYREAIRYARKEAMTPNK